MFFYHFQPHILSFFVVFFKKNVRELLSGKNTLLQIIFDGCFLPTSSLHYDLFLL